MSMLEEAMPRKTEKNPESPLVFFAATKDRWKDLEKLFGERGACAGCWCMVWRRPRKEYEAGKGAGNKRAFKKLVISGEVPGILAYDGDRPIGWCSVAPRETFLTLQKSRALASIDDNPVWSISCLFIDKLYRNQGVAVAMLKAACDYVRSQGGKIVEGYPSVTAKKLPDAWVWTGVLPAFLSAGYREVKRPSASRAIVRKKL
jgi:GNAT superfamily N-acetyltransferase